MAANARSGAADATPAIGRDAVLGAALACFMANGFHGTSMRDIAAKAGTSISTTYYYFASKAALLRAIMVGVIEDLIAALERALAEAGNDPAAQLAALVRTHVRLHTERQDESFIGNSELRSLTAKDRTEILALRDRIGVLFKQTIARGLKTGQFHCTHPAEANLAILTMCTAVAGWYRAGGPTPATAIADRYAQLALRMVGLGPGGTNTGTRRS